MSSANKSAFSRTAEAGFTLVELMMAVVTGSIVLIGIAVMVAGSYEYLSEGRTRTNLQQDYSFVELLLANNVKPCRIDDVTIYSTFSDFLSGQSPQSTGTCMKAILPSADWNVFYKDGSAFKIMRSDSTKETVITKGISDLQFTKQTNAIEVYVNIAVGGWSADGTLVFATRN